VGVDGFDQGRGAVLPATPLPVAPGTTNATPPTFTPGTPALDVSATSQTDAGTSGDVRTDPPQGSKKKKDPLFVLDANNAVVVTTGIVKHDFAGYNVDLRAQVTGATVAANGYQWTLTPAADFQNVSGLGTSRLTFTWATFTGAAHTDTVDIRTT